MPPKKKTKQFIKKKATNIITDTKISNDNTSVEIESPVKLNENELQEKVKEEKSSSDYSALKTTVSKWKSLQQKKKDLSKQIKDINTEGNTLKELIMKHMDKLDIGVISTSDGTIELVTKKQKEGFKEDMIEDNLKDYLKNAVEAEAITKHIVSNRKIKLVQDLKFTKKK